jgi:hypothetical protein
MKSKRHYTSSKVTIFEDFIPLQTLHVNFAFLEDSNMEHLLPGTRVALGENISSYVTSLDVACTFSISPN